MTQGVNQSNKIGRSTSIFKGPVLVNKYIAWGEKDGNKKMLSG